jgi:hypothetical protein
MPYGQSITIVILTILTIASVSLIIVTFAIFLPMFTIRLMPPVIALPIASIECRCRIASTIIRLVHRIISIAMVAIRGRVARATAY